GQVHSATTRKGERAAVKVQAPDVATAVISDLRVFEILDRLWRVLFRGQRSGVLWEEIATRLLEECDYALEADHQRRFAVCWSGQDDIRIPRVFDESSAGGVLTSERVDGCSLDEFVARAGQDARDRAGLAIWRFYFESIFRDHHYNTDPQPDNLLFADDG